jgi:hypothetical protein
MMENRADGHAERRFAVVAIMPPIIDRRALGLAVWTPRLIAPSRLLKVLDAAFGSGKLLKNLYNVHGFLSWFGSVDSIDKNQFSLGRAESQYLKLGNSV